MALLRRFRTEPETEEVPEREEPEDEQADSDGGGAPLVARLVGLFVVFNVVCALISIGIALYIKRTHPSVGDEDSDELDLVTIFDGIELKSRSTAFRGGSWITMFGGGELDLRDATLDPSGATLQVKAIMGGGDVIVPDGWNVELSSKSLMGGVGMRRPNATEDPYAPTLRVEARALMGGFGVSSPD
jgi:hypothetical protein